MMKVGYTVSEDNIAELEKVCDKVRYVNKINQTSQSFLTFVTDNLSNQIVVKNVDDIGLQLVQMVPGLKELKKNNKDIIFLEKGAGQDLSDRAYNALLLEYAVNEKNIMSYRTTTGMEAARERNGNYGRPQTREETIQHIQYLARGHNRTIREIAKISGASIGTVHKYVSEINH